jgi:hypothetical protein
VTSNWSTLLVQPRRVVAWVVVGLGDLVALDRKEQVDQFLAHEAAQDGVLSKAFRAASRRVGMGVGPSMP